jgi:hypothetical protein
MGKPDQNRETGVSSGFSSVPGFPYSHSRHLN